MPDLPTLIATLQIDERSQAYFDGLRKTWFPKHLNFIPAHITLLHKIPADADRLAEKFIQVTNRDLFRLMVSSVRNTGNGVAFTLASDELQRLHKTLQQQFDKYLISQDRQLLLPHITVQNRVTAYRALQTTNLLGKDFTPFEITATGINTWQYLKGPWMLHQRFPFYS